MTVKIVSSTSVAARLLRYTVKDKAGQTEPRVLHMAGLNCRPETAEREFATTRRKHDTQSATRMSPAKFELPEPGEVATHVRRTRPNGRRVWMVAKDHETATHVRRGGELVRQAEARHLITSFGLDEVNPDDPEQVARAFEYVVAEHSALYPGEQAHFVGQADGKKHKFHVHTVRNATLFADMDVDGKLYKAGSKLAGDLTDIDKIRDRSDAFLAEHGAEYGLEPQRLASTAERKRETRSTRDRRMAAKGEKSNHDIIRDAFEDSLADPRAVDLDAFVEVMQEHGVAVNHRVTRKGKPGETHALSYRLPEMPQNVRGTSLGEYYAFESAIAQLEANAAGLPRESRPERVQAGPPRPVDLPTNAELAEARAVVAQLAAAEHTEQISDQMARDYFAAAGEDFDAATAADRTGDHETLAKLARVGREREAFQKTQPAPEPATEVTEIPEGKAVLLPVVEPVEAEIPQPRQPEMLVPEEIVEPTPVGAPSAPAPVAVQPESEPEPDLATVLLPFDDDLPAAQPASNKPKSSAPAPDFSRVPGAAPALPVPSEPEVPAKDEAPYVSRLRGHRTKNPKTQSVVDAMAVFDENAREALLRGERVRESDIPKGVGPNFLQALGDKLDPLVFEQLQLREAKKARANRFYDAGKRAVEKLTEMGKLAEAQGDTLWQYGKAAEDLALERKVANRTRNVLREQIAAGVYEEVQGTAWKTRSAIATTQEQPEVEPRSL